MSQHPPQWQPTNPPAPPVKQSWFARHKVLSVVLGVTMLVVVICCGAGIAMMAGGDEATTGAGSTTSESASAATGSSDDGPTRQEPAEDEAAEEAPAEDKADEEAPADDPAEEMTTEQANAVRAAENYLDFMPFSKKGLIEQLSSPAGDDYPRDVAQFAVEHIESGVDWKEQAVKSAENYLDMMPFSRSELIQQLTSDAGEGFTREQAEHAADEVGL